MKITRRFALATLLVLAVAVVLGAPAPASAASATFKLYPAADSPFPHATGMVNLSPEVGFLSSFSVSVSKLAPNASYYTPVTVRSHDYYWGYYDYVYNVPIQTDARGNGKGGFGRSDSLITSYLFQVYDASGTLVLTSNR